MCASPSLYKLKANPVPVILSPCGGTCQIYVQAFVWYSRALIDHLNQQRICILQAGTGNDLYNRLANAILLLNRLLKWLISASST
jgi:hypothetical protein